MSYEAEFIVNTGPYEHVKLTVSGRDEAEFILNLTSFTDHTKGQLGIFQAELKSWAMVAYENPSGFEVPVTVVEEPAEDPVAVVQETLGATVLEVEEKAVEAAPEAASKPWQRKLDPKPKPWDGGPELTDKISKGIEEAKTGKTKPADDGWGDF